MPRKNRREKKRVKEQMSMENKGYESETVILPDAVDSSLFDTGCDTFSGLSAANPETQPVPRGPGFTDWI